MTFSREMFERDIAKHELQVIRDDGVNRHLRFQRPGSMDMHFDLLTWPGYLCYTGDMGTFVFQRLNDMFQFFRRRDGRGPYGMDLRYWAEKLEAADRGDGVREWCKKKFRAEVRDVFEQDTSDDDDWPAARKDALWQEIDDRVCDAADDSEHHAWVALWEFEHDGFRFQDWERDCKVWTHRFLWCCHALEWGIDTYDRAKRPAPVAGVVSAAPAPPAPRPPPPYDETGWDLEQWEIAVRAYNAANPDAVVPWSKDLVRVDQLVLGGYGVGVLGAVSRWWKANRSHVPGARS